MKADDSYVRLSGQVQTSKGIEPGTVMVVGVLMALAVLLTFVLVLTVYQYITTPNQPKETTCPQPKK